jgi:tetratricopeptide (TPR) repeat protein
MGQQASVIPGHVRAMLALAIAVHERGLLDDAQAYHQQILEQVPDFPESLHLLGVIAHQKGDHLKAAQLIGQAISLNPTDAGYHVNLGDVYLAQHKYAEALDCFMVALRHNPLSALAWAGLGHVAFLQSEDQKAYQHYHKAITLSAQNVDIRLRLADLAADMGLYDEAISHIQVCQKQNPLPPAALKQQLVARLGIYQALAGYKADAEQSLKQAAALDANNAEVRAVLGQLYVQSGRAEEAIIYLNRCLEIDPGRGAALLDRAVAYAKLGEMDACLRDIEMAEKQHPDDPFVLFVLGNTLLDVGYPAYAAEFYQAVISHLPDFAEARYNAGIAAMEMADFAQAEAYFQAALHCQADYAKAHHGVLSADLWRPDASLPKLMADMAALPQAGQATLRYAMPPAAMPDSASSQGVMPMHVGILLGVPLYHPLARMVFAWAEQNLLPAHIKVTVYHDVPLPVSSVMPGMWKNIAGQGDEEVLRQMRWDDLDVLIDTIGFSGVGRPQVLQAGAATTQLFWPIVTPGFYPAIYDAMLVAPTQAYTKSTPCTPGEMAERAVTIAAAWAEQYPAAALAHIAVRGAGGAFYPAVDMAHPLPLVSHGRMGVYVLGQSMVAHPTVLAALAVCLQNFPVLDFIFCGKGFADPKFQAHIMAQCRIYMKTDRTDIADRISFFPVGRRQEALAHSYMCIDVAPIANPFLQLEAQYCGVQVLRHAIGGMDLKGSQENTQENKGSDMPHLAAVLQPFVHQFMQLSPSDHAGARERVKAAFVQTDQAAAMAETVMPQFWKDLQKGLAFSD